MEKNEKNSIKSGCGVECFSRKCNTCGWNSEEEGRRKEYIRKHGLIEGKNMTKKLGLKTMRKYEKEELGHV